MRIYRYHTAIFCIALLLVTISLLLSQVRMNGAAINLNQGLVEKSAEKIDRAIYRLQQAHTIPQHRILATAYTYQNQPYKAAEQWELSDTKAEQLMTFGYKASLEDKYESAIKWYEQAQQVNVELADPLFYIGLNYESLGLDIAADQAYQQALQREQYQTVGKSDILYHRAAVIAKRETPPDWKAVRPLLTQAVEEEDFRRGYFTYAEALRLIGRKNQAINAYKTVVAQTPLHFRAHLTLGYLIWGQQKDAKQAENHFQTALKISSEHTSPYLGLALIYQQTNRIDQAIAMYDQVLELEPNNQQAQQVKQRLLQGK